MLKANLTITKNNNLIPSSLMTTEAIQSIYLFKVGAEVPNNTTISATFYILNTKLIFTSD